MMKPALRFVIHPALALFAIIAVISLSSLARADEAMGWVGDLPVPSQALIETQSAVNFDSPSGRVIQFTFQIALSDGDVQAFYQAALPELGWQAVSGGFVRGNERMTIKRAEIQDAGARSSYDVSVSPLQ